MQGLNDLLGKIGKGNGNKKENESSFSMSMGSNWREKLPPELNQEINELASRTQEHRGAYQSTLKVRDAQQWVALAQLSKRIKELEKKLEEKD